MSADDADIPVHTNNSRTTPTPPHLTMPIQLNNPSQVSSNIARMVSNMIPQIEEQLIAQINDSPELVAMAAPQSGNVYPAPPPPRPVNPYLAQGRHAHSHHGHSHNVPRGHARSLSQGQGYFRSMFDPQGATDIRFNAPQQHTQAFNTPSQPAENPPATNNAPHQNFVIDFGGDDGHTLDNTTPQDSNNNGRRATTNPLANMRTLWKASEGSIPFVVLLLVKILFDHRLGILVLVGLFGTYYHANSSLKRQISQRDTHGIFDALGNLCWIIVFLAANIAFIYYVFDEQKLYRSLYFQVPEFNKIDIWNLCWIVGVTDFVIKYATIILKAGIALLPKPILPLKKKGKHYMLIEVTSQCYRSVVPTLPWLMYLYDTEHGGWVFAHVLCGTYMIFKVTHMYGKLQELRKAIASFRLDVSYGTVPRREDLQNMDNCCPICQDKLTEPVKLSCSHIFCEDCVSMWFDREKTCPMCRAQIVDNPMWRDGTTSANVAVF